MEKGGGIHAVGSLTKAKVPTVKNLIQKYSHDIPCYGGIQWYTLLTLVRARLYRFLHLRYIKDWVTRVHAMIDGRGQIDYSIVPNSRLRLIFKCNT